MEKTKGSFTLPGEAGYEELTLKLAERWGADAVSYTHLYVCLDGPVFNYTQAKYLVD